MPYTSDVNTSRNIKKKKKTENVKRTQATQLQFCLMEIFMEALSAQLIKKFPAEAKKVKLVIFRKLALPEKTSVISRQRKHFL